MKDKLAKKKAHFTSCIMYCDFSIKVFMKAIAVEKADVFKHSVKLLIV
jgi:hypothetical protein